MVGANNRGAHDPQEQAREKAREMEDLWRREEAAVDRLANEAMQVRRRDCITGPWFEAYFSGSGMLVTVFL